MPTQKQQADQLADGCARFLAGLIFFPFVALLDGWALMLLWGWYVVPATEWPAIGLWTAIGLMLIKPVVSFRYSQADIDAEEDKPGGVLLGSKIITGVTLTLLALFFGWVLHFWA